MMKRHKSPCGILLATSCLCFFTAWNMAWAGEGSIDVSASPTELLVGETAGGTISITKPDMPANTGEYRYSGEVIYSGPSVSGKYTPFATTENPEPESSPESGVGIGGTAFTFTGSKPGTWEETFTVTFSGVKREKYNTETETWEYDGEHSFESATTTSTFTVKAIVLSVSGQEYIPVKNEFNQGRYGVTVTASPKPKTGTITLTAGGGKINLYGTETGGTASASLSWSATQEKYEAYMEGTTASNGVGDQTLTATYSGAGTEPASTSVTVVSVDISAPRWTKKSEDESKPASVTLSYKPDDLDTEKISLGGDATGFFQFYEMVENETTGEEEEQEASSNWTLPRDESTISLTAQGKEPGNGKLTVTHAPSGAKKEIDAGVYHLDAVMDELEEDQEEAPGVFLGHKKRKKLGVTAAPTNAGGKIKLTLGSGLSLFYAETGGTPVTTREWNLDDENLNKLYIQGDAASTSKTDQKDCKIEWTGVTGLSAEDTVKVTVVQVDIAGTGYSEPNAEEETKGMFIHAKATKTVTLNYYPSDLDYGVLKLAPQESEHLKILVPAETAGEDPLALSTFEWDLAEDEEPPKNLIIEGTKYGEVTLEVEHVQTEAEDKAKTTVFECRVEISAETGEASERLADVVQAPGWIKFERKIKPEGLPEDVKYFAIHLKFETITALPAGGSSNAAKFGADTPSRPAGNGGAAETFAQFWERKNLGKVRPEFIDKDYDLVAQAKGNNAALRAFQAGGGYIDEPSMAIRYKCTGQLNADQTVGMLRLDPVFDWLDEGEKTDFDSPTPESKQGEDAVLELTEASWDGMPGNWDPLAGEETEEDGEGSDEENGGNAESKTTAKIEIKDGAYLCIRTDSNNDGTIDDADDDPDVKNSSDHHGHIMEVNYDDDDKNEKEDRNEFPNVNDYTNESIMRGFAPYVFISVSVHGV